jgi:hypothetical protein
VGHVEEALVLLLNLRQHLYQECLTFVRFSEQDGFPRPRRVQFFLKDLDETL